MTEGDTVIIDNASPHKVAGVKEVIEATGARLVYLPPYHPDLNPIELAWNKMKHYLRKQRPRTADDLYDAYAKALEGITKRDADDFLSTLWDYLLKWLV